MRFDSNSMVNMEEA